MNAVRQLVLLQLLAVALTMTVGAAHSSGMMMSDGKMENCPYMGVVALCDMNPPEHLFQWQQLFTTTAPHVSTFALFLLLATFLLWRFIDNFSYRHNKEEPVAYQIDKIDIFDFLRLAFARGLIHPKVF
jgi:hypothetical protein